MSLKNNFLRRVSAILLCVALLCIQVPFMASADTVNLPDASYSMPSTVSGSKGDSVTVPVTIKFSPSTNRAAINGIMFTVKYDTDKLSFVSGSESSSISGMSVFDKNGVITCAWTDTKEVLVSSGAKVISLQFKILDNATGTGNINFEHKQLYYSTSSASGVDFYNYNVTTKTASTGVSIGEDSAVVKVINAIDAIGTVEYTDECLEKISNANKLYSQLTNAQKALVTNADALKKAAEEYERLKQQAAQDIIDKEVDAYKEAHKEALALNVDNVTTKDWDKLTKASEEFKKLTPQAQAELLTEYRNTNFLLELLKEAKAAEDEAARLEQLKEWEKQLARAYVFGGYTVDTSNGNTGDPWINGLLEPTSEWLDCVTKTEKNVTANDFSRLNYFKQTWYDTITGLCPPVIDIMNDEADGLSDQFLAAYNKAKTLYDLANTEKTPDELSAEQFIANFGYILGLTTETVTYDDLAQIEIAKTVYGYLTTGAQALLTDEYALIESLYNTASTLDPGTDDVAGPVGDTYDQSAEANSFVSAFNSTWASVLGMNPDEVTGEDYPVLLAMITNYETLCALNPAVADALGDQMKAIYEMADKAKALYDGGATGSDSAIAGPGAVGWDANNVLKFMNRDMGVIVWVLLALLALSTVVFVVLRVFYYYLKKDKALFVEEAAI